MSDFLNKSSVLVLNSLYQCIGTLSPKKALVALNSQSDQSNIVAKVIDVVYKKNDDGTFDLNQLEYWRPIEFSEWVTLEPRPEIDQTINTPKIKIRIPTVIVTNYNKMPMRKFRATKSLLYEIQKGVCGYSGKKISIKKGNIEHKQPKSKGGKDTFENLMFVDAEINSKRGNKPLDEVGLRPLFNHKTPKPMPVHYTIKQAFHPDWKWFVNVE